MTQIKYIEDTNGNKIFPITHERSVRDDNGVTLETKLGIQSDLINQAQMEIGAVESDLTPTENSAHWVTSGGVYSAIGSLGIYTTSSNNGRDLDIADYLGNILASFKDGHLETKECVYLSDVDMDGLVIADEETNILAWIVGGEIVLKNFNSVEIKKRIYTEYYDMEIPQNAVMVYNTCNDIDKTTNKWGIDSRNYGVSIYLDHFIYPSNVEKSARFDTNGKTFVNLSQQIVGQSNTWNNGVTSLSTPITFSLNEGSNELSIVNRQILNSATNELFPKVLQIGDSVTQGWFANYPTLSDTPTTSWSWAKYFFQKDKAQKGSGYDSLFIGTLNGINITYDGVNVKGFAEGRGGWSAKTYWSSQSSGNIQNAFYSTSIGHFSLQEYLDKYKTLDDNGITRLVVGDTAGTSVSDVNAYDVCTPNIVVLQTGMNGSVADWETYTINIIKQIKSEFPNMKIIINCIDAALCMFPSLYPQYDNISLTDYDNAHSRMIDIMKWAIDTLPEQEYELNGVSYSMTEINGIYVMYSGAIMPMPYSCNTREIVNPLGSLHDKLIRYVGVDAIERVKHPSRFAHAAIGYELYSAIKWVLIN